jgi:hypothetical protein
MFVQSFGDRVCGEQNNIVIFGCTNTSPVIKGGMNLFSSCDRGHAFFYFRVLEVVA